jgi:hypothetical protein
MKTRSGVVKRITKTAGTSSCAATKANPEPYTYDNSPQVRDALVLFYTKFARKHEVPLLPWHRHIADTLTTHPRRNMLVNVPQRRSGTTTGIMRYVAWRLMQSDHYRAVVYVDMCIESLASAMFGMFGWFATRCGDFGVRAVPEKGGAPPIGVLFVCSDTDMQHIDVEEYYTETSGYPYGEIDEVLVDTSHEIAIEAASSIDKLLFGIRKPRVVVFEAPSAPQERASLRKAYTTLMDPGRQLYSIDSNGWCEVRACAE